MTLSRAINQIEFDKATHDKLKRDVAVLREAAIKVVASSHEFQDGQHDTKPGTLNVDREALIALAALLTSTQESAR